jgi:tetratricopeptide (TPR) repeat protein
VSAGALGLLLALALPGLAPPVAARPAAAGDEASDVARTARELRRDGRVAEALAVFDGRAPALLADLRVAGERIQALLDAGRAADAAAADAALGPVKEGPTPLAVARARLATARGEAHATLTWTESVGPLREHPDVAAARLEALLALDRLAEALEAVKVLPADMPAPMRARLDVDVRLRRARAMLEDADLVERAIPLLEEAQKLQPERDEVKVELVNALALWHHAEQAEAVAKEVLDRTEGPARAPMLCALGAVRRAELRDDDAAQCFEQVLELVPEHPRATVALARCRLRQGREAEGLSLLRGRLARAPNDPDALFAMAEHQLENRDAAEAANGLRRVLKQRPGSLKALYMLSRAMAQLEQPEEQQKILAEWTKRREALATN